MKFRILSIGLLLGVLLIAVTPVSAHSELVRMTPDANARLDRAPAQIELYFSEAVEPGFSKITALDANGAKVDNNDSRVDPADPTHLTVSLRSLKDGVYTVSWQVVSAVDAHPTSGSYPFSVGNVDPNALAGVKATSSGSNLLPGEVAVKGLLYLICAALAGGTLFALLVWRPSLQAVEGHTPDPTGFPPLYRQAMLASLVALGFVNLLGILVQAGIGARAVLAPPWDPQVLNVLLDTRYGALVLARFGLLFALAGLLLPPPNAWNRWTALPVLTLLLLTLSLGSHAAASEAPLFPVLVDLAHLAAASVWVGGLFLFLAGLLVSRRLERPARTRLAAVLIPRFSALALVSVGTLVLTGTYAALQDVGSWNALVQTPYGQALTVKLLLALFMVGLGANNLLRVTPRMRKAAQTAGNDSGQVSQFRRLLTGEVVLGAVLLAWVGVFTSLPPARTVSGSGEYLRSTQVDDLNLRLTISPARVGINTFTLEVASGGKAVADASEVTLRFSPETANLAPSEARLVGQGNGKYSLKGAYLSLPDRWQIQAVVRRRGHFDAYANFDLNTSAVSGPAVPPNRVAGILLVFVATTIPLAFFLNLRDRLGWMVFGQLVAFALILAGLLTYLHPATGVDAEPVNPVPSSAASVALGRTVYQNNCLSCHGPAGKGDGPIGLTLNPRPADLSLHAVPGVHTDGQLFAWISNGYPGSAMLGFSQTLSETDRWNLVNFIRTFAVQ